MVYSSKNDSFVQLFINTNDPYHSLVDMGKKFFDEIFTFW